MPSFEAIDPMRTAKSRGNQLVLVTGGAHFNRRPEDRADGGVLGPLLLAFPLWFALNRVGQHYDINPADPAHWTTQLRRNHLLEFIMLWSNYHHEHHAFPGVPFYNLTKLHRLMRDCQVSRQNHDRGYRDLLWNWLIRNRAPHTRWTST